MYTDEQKKQLENSRSNGFELRSSTLASVSEPASHPACWSSSRLEGTRRSRNTLPARRRFCLALVVPGGPPLRHPELAASPSPATPKFMSNRCVMMQMLRGRLCRLAHPLHNWLQGHAGVAFDLPGDSFAPFLSRSPSRAHARGIPACSNFVLSEANQPTRPRCPPRQLNALNRPRRQSTVHVQNKPRYKTRQQLHRQPAPLLSYGHTFQRSCILSISP